MRKDITITVQTATKAADTEGYITCTWTAAESIVHANRQPLDGQTALREYGIQEVGLLALFFTDVTTAIRTRRGDGDPQRIVHGTDTFDIVGVYPWDNHYEVIGKPVGI